MIRPPFCLCLASQAPVIFVSADFSFIESFPVKAISHNVFSIGLIPQGSFSALRVCFTAIPPLSRDSTRFFLSDTASKSALMHSHQRSLPSQLRQGPCCSQLIVLVSLRRRRHSLRHHHRSPVSRY